MCIRKSRAQAERTKDRVLHGREERLRHPESMYDAFDTQEIIRIIRIIIIIRIINIIIIIRISSTTTFMQRITCSASSWPCSASMLDSTFASASASEVSRHAT